MECRLMHIFSNSFSLDEYLINDGFNTNFFHFLIVRAARVSKNSTNASPHISQLLFENSIKDDLKTQPSKAWKELKYLANKAETSSTPKDISADSLSSFFESVFSRNPDVNFLPTQSFTVPSISRELLIDYSLILTPRSAKILSTTQMSFSSPYQTVFFEKLASFMSAALSYNFIQHEWTCVKITPLPKTFNPQTESDYRPISNLPIFLGLVDSICNHLLTQHIKINTMDPAQHGFIRNRSTSTNLVSFFNKIDELRHRRIPSVAIFLDIAKAFDKFPFNIIQDALITSDINQSVAKLIGHSSPKKLGSNIP